ncbi:MAG: hypothetical protein A4E67_02215 [Syntrophaceae bacterium PtaB.Bin038]|nr:MAG: hypothetical protein A4E67_02215 [Syntrophaceae bacterium PtaB.Bin038]
MTKNKKRYPCPDCSGTGSTPDIMTGEPITCEVCDGAGIVTRLQYAAFELENAGILGRTGVCALYVCGRFHGKSRASVVWSWLRDNPDYETIPERNAREAAELDHLNRARAAAGLPTLAAHPRENARREEAFRLATR